MTCRTCNKPSNGNLCGKCTLEQFGSPYTADLKRDEAYRQQRTRLDEELRNARRGQA